MLRAVATSEPGVTGMISTRREFVGLLAISFTIAAGRTPAQAQPDRVYAAVVLYDVSPGQEGNFVKAIQSPHINDRDRSSFIDDRVLVNIDELTLQYASYTKFSRIGPATRFLDSRLMAVGPMCRRAPEAHLVQLRASYTPRGEIERPKGL